ncbi:MAG: choice-of-anchor M domain-containing protein [Microbacterium sp.]
MAASGLLLPIVFGGGIAAAAEGAAPAPTEYRVLETEHSDTIATFWDGGDFALGSKADVDGSLGVRFPADGILIHVNDLARYDSWPAGYEFVAPTGSTVWLAPQTRKDGVVWPGFSTESVPSGVLNGNITFTLDDVTGPGSVELWTSNAFGGVQERLWSSDEAVKSFARPINTHMHANWAFTQPGTYRRPRRPRTQRCAPPSRELPALRASRSAHARTARRARRRARGCRR